VSQVYFSCCDITMPASEPSPNQNPVKTVRSEELLAGAAEILIEHSGMVYRLRVTRQDKLILTK
jgi:hemin uptake protein HemP